MRKYFVLWILLSIPLSLVMGQVLARAEKASAPMPLPALRWIGLSQTRLNRLPILSLRKQPVSAHGGFYN